ncbi:hypothetical protein AX16_008705 [Volvariella volvacea WC 439]|nr:hypothetical protein AX16_008705 [Volvariella volvacea WC 439]
MLLASIFLSALARSLASPIPPAAPSTFIPSPLCAAAAALSGYQCDANKTRTVFDLLYGCLGVIFLCTYISIHHNIPDQSDSWLERIWLKARTTIYAMIAPEVVIMWALRQRIMAAEIAYSDWGKEHGWTRAHGFFVQMGGLMLEVEKGKRYEVIRWKTFLVRDKRLYDSRGVRIDNIPGIKEKEIMDHGKGDVLSKAIVVLQTSWFVAQCIACQVEGLVLTEIELVTLAFAALNVVTYLLWWDKPLNVEYPVYFDREGNRVDGPELEKGDPWHIELRKWVMRQWNQRAGEGGGVGILRGIQDDIEEDGVLKTIWKRGMKQPISIIFRPFLEMANAEFIRRSTSVHPFYAAALEPDQHRLAFLCASVISVIFGSIHLIS